MQNIKKIRPAWLEIDMDKILHNMSEIRRIVRPQTQIMAVLKANAYEHGACEMAELLQNRGADRFAVAELDEAIELRRHNITAPILILGTILPEQAPEVVLYGIDVPIFDYHCAAAFSQEAVRQQRTIRFHIKIDTGMGRIGYRPSPETIEEIVKISKLPNVIIDGIFTHFATADEADKSFTREQYQKFIGICGALEKRGVKINVRHCANSAAIIDLPEYNCDMVRAGIILYGFSPSPEVNMKNTTLAPVMSFKCRITYIKKIAKGDSISYGRKFIASSERIIATLPVGYADGYTRMLSGKAQVLVHGKRAKVVGNICMDQCMIDITDIRGVEVGDEVVLYGTQGDDAITPDELAAKLGTINYEILCMMPRRLPRIYLRHNKPVVYTNYLLRL